MKKISTLLLLTLFSFISQAQAPFFQWARASLGSGTINRGRDCATDAMGNIYTTGYFRGTVDMDPSAGVFNLTSYSTSLAGDAFIQKLDANGNFVWALSIESDASSSGLVWAICNAVDGQGNVYVSGLITGVADFDPSANSLNLGSPGPGQAFLAKYSPSGSLVWAKVFGVGLCRDITIDINDNIILHGDFSGSGDFDPGAGVTTLGGLGRRCFTAKFNSLGQFQWANEFINSIPNGSLNGYGLTTDALGNIYTAGDYGGSVDFDPGVGSNVSVSTIGNSQAYITKLDSLGNFIWHKTTTQVSAGIASNCSAASIHLDNNQNLLLTGSFSGSIDFDPNSATAVYSASSLDIFALKLDTVGSYIWNKQIGGTGFDAGHIICTDNSNNVWITGGFQNTVDFDPGANITSKTSNGQLDMFFLKLDNLGNYIWSGTAGGSNNDYGFGVDVNSADQIFFTGYFNGSVDFDPNAGVSIVNGNTVESSFVMKLNSINCQPTSGTDVVTACDSFTWMNGVTYFANNNTAQDTILNTLGCDSIVTLNLTINSADKTVSQNNLSLTANAIGGIYQWIDCATNLPITGATLQSYTVSANGSYAAVVTQNGCTDTTNCISFMNVGIIDDIQADNILIYPNPSNGNFTLEFGDNQLYSVEILDALGKVIYEKENAKGKNLLNVNAVSGLYLMRISVHGTNNFYKLVLE